MFDQKSLGILKEGRVTFWIMAGNDGGFEKNAEGEKG